MGAEHRPIASNASASSAGVSVGSGAPDTRIRPTVNDPRDDAPRPVVLAVVQRTPSIRTNTRDVDRADARRALRVPPRRGGGDARVGDRMQPVDARSHREDRTRRGRSAPRPTASSSRPRTPCRRRMSCPSAVFFVVRAVALNRVGVQRSRDLFGRDRRRARAAVGLREEETEEPEVDGLRLRVALLSLGACDRTSERHRRLGAADEAARAQRLRRGLDAARLEAVSRRPRTATGRRPASTTVPVPATARGVTPKRDRGSSTPTTDRLQPPVSQRNPYCGSPKQRQPVRIDSCQHRRQCDARQPPDAVLLHDAEAGGLDHRAHARLRGPRPGPQDAGLLAQQAGTDARYAG